MVVAAEVVITLLDMQEREEMVGEVLVELTV
jgi:hypothetical protein